MQNKIRSFNQFKTTLEKDPTLQEEFKSNPVEAIKKFQSAPPRFNDKLIYRLAVLFLGIIVLTICIGAIILTGRSTDPGFEVPDILVATASTAIGAVAGLLAPGSN
ncbi:hypothetical protein [Aquimarina sp. AU58]|uniref:hypothetical protein n=1 Tax=Aquimarina sp. AU58 TaxID=1874112 RepID=UPI000D641CCD|nr:hypothetical protein [Aquimarina sp. AU58]